MRLSKKVTANYAAIAVCNTTDKNSLSACGVIK
jgi:hypothetical protein